MNYRAALCGPTPLSLIFLRLPRTRSGEFRHTAGLSLSRKQTHHYNLASLCFPKVSGPSVHETSVHETSVHETSRNLSSERIDMVGSTDLAPNNPPSWSRFRCYTGPHVSKGCVFGFAGGGDDWRAKGAFRDLYGYGSGS